MSTSVQGNLKDLSGAVATGNMFLRFRLRGLNGNIPRVNGTALIPQTLGDGSAQYVYDFTPDVNGAITGTLYSTRDAAGTGNGDIEAGGSFTAVWYGMVLYVGGQAASEIAVHAKNGATLDPSNVTPITTTPVTTAPTGDTTYARLDAGNQPFTGNIQAPVVTASTGFRNGTATAGRVLRADGTNFIAAQLAAADLSNGVAGSGAVVLANTPTLITPVIGAATGTSLALGGGTALTTTNRTGTGNLVLATSPTLVTPVLGVASGTSLALAGALTGATLTGASSGNSTNLLNQQNPTGTLTGTGVAQTVYTYSLPANTVATGKSLYLRTMFNHNSGTASVTYVLSLNGTTLLTFASSTAGSHVIDIDILNTGATTGATMELFGAASSPAGSTVGSGLAWASNQTLLLTFNVANTDQVTGQGWKLTLDQ